MQNNFITTIKKTQLVLKKNSLVEFTYTYHLGDLEFSSYKTDSCKMTSHLELLTPKFLQKFFFRVTNSTSVVQVNEGSDSKRKNKKLEISSFKKYRVLKKSFVNIFNKPSKFLLYNFYTLHFLNDEISSFSGFFYLGLDPSFTYTALLAAKNIFIVKTLFINHKFA